MKNLKINELQREKYLSDMCAQRRLRPVYAFAQPDQNLHWAHFG